MNPITRELINTFMREAKSKHDIRSGHNQNYNEAIGLVDVSICFEAINNELLPSEPDQRIKREYFSTTYQDFFNKHKNTFKDWVNFLKEELDANGYLKDMAPKSKRAPLNIINPDNLIEIIEVIYRVRCNLVHGSKDLTEKRNNLLIENSFKFLYNLLDMIFREKNII